MTGPASPDPPPPVDLRLNIRELLRQMRDKARTPDDRERDSVWSWRVDDWADDVERLFEATLCAAAPQRQEPPTP